MPWKKQKAFLLTPGNRGFFQIDTVADRKWKFEVVTGNGNLMDVDSKYCKCLWLTLEVDHLRDPRPPSTKCLP